MTAHAFQRSAPDPVPPSRSRRVAKVIVAFVVLPIVLGALIVLVLATTPWGNEQIRRMVVSQANGRLTGQLSIGRLRGNLFRSATLTDVKVVDSAGKPLLVARRARIEYGLWSALRGHIVIRSLALDSPVVVLDKPPGSRWNFQTLLPPSLAPADTARRGTTPELANISITNGRLVLRQPWRPDSSLSGPGRDSAIRVALGATSRNHIERVSGGFQRVIEFHDVDARLPVVQLAHAGAPTQLRIDSLSMVAVPFRGPTGIVRSLAGTLYASKDSLWWRDMRVILPASRIATTGRVGLNGNGLALSATGDPLAFADLHWIDARVPVEGGGRLSIAMRVAGDTAEYVVTDANLRYRGASVVGNASVARVAHRGARSIMLVRGADLTVARLSTALVRELAPTLKLPRSGTIDGHLAARGAPSALQVDADVRFADAAAGVSRVLAHGGVGLEHGFRALGLQLQMRPLQLASLAGTGMRLPIGGELAGSALVSGASREGWNVRGDLTHVEHGDRSHVIGNGRYQALGKRIVADATLQPLSLATVGRFAPAAQLRGGVTGRVHAEGTTSALSMSGVFRSTNGGGSVDGRGTVELAGSRTRYDIAASLDALNVSAFSRRAPRTRLTGTVSARGRGTSPATMDAVIAANLVRSHYDTLGVDRLTARLAVANGLLRADTLDVLATGAAARASGTLGLVAGRDGAMHVAVAVDSLQMLRRWLGTSDSSSVAPAVARQNARLAAARADSARRAEATRIERLALGLPPGERLIVDTLTPIRRDSLSGSLAADATLRGNVKRLGVDAIVHGRDLVLRGNAAQRLDATLSTPNVRDRATPLAFRVDADSVQTAGYAFERVQGTGSWSGGRLEADLRVRQDAAVSYAALGSYARPAAGVQEVRLDSLNAHFDTLTWRLAHPGGLRVDHGAVSIDSVDLRSSAGGRLFANGVLPKEGGVRLDAAAENVRVATVLQVLQRDARADGVIAATASIDGTRRDPGITGRVALRGASYSGTRAPDADVDIRYSTRRLTLTGEARDSVGRRVLQASASLPVDLALSGVSGSRRLPGDLAADVVLDSLALAALPLSSRSFEDVRGAVAGDVHVRGSWRTPEYTGRAALRGGGLTVVSTGMRLTDAAADARLIGDTLRLDSLVARARGTLRADGTVSLADRSQPFVHLRAEGRDLRIMDATRGLVDADGEITAVGPLDAVRVNGRAEMLHGFLALKQFRKDLLRVKSPGDLNFFTVYDTTRPVTDSLRAAAAAAQHHRVGVIADLSLVVDRGNYYRNRPDANTEFFTGEGEEVRAHIDTRSGETWAAGFVRIGGGVAIFRARTFVPERGSLTFSRYTGGPGFLEQLGSREVWEPGRGVVPIELLTGGTSKGPAVGLESGTLFPIRGRELNGYLTMGRERSLLLQQSGSSLSGSESWSGQLSGETGALARRQQAATALGVVLHDIGTGATKEFGLDAFSVSPADVPTELVFGKTGGVRGALVEGGRYMTVDRYVAGQLRLTTGIPGARISQLFGGAYRFDAGVEPRFLFRAPEDLGITHPTVRTGAFSAFLTRMWEW